MLNRIANIAGIISCILIIIACFLPWTHYNSINETFTGFRVSRFAGGNYYGRAGLIITFIAGIILIFSFVPRIWAKRINLFLAALLVAYTIRTYIIFTSAMFEGEVDKKIGIYLIVLLAPIILVSTVFPAPVRSKAAARKPNS